MKKFTHFFLGLCMLSTLGAQAQDFPAATRNRATLRRCATEDVINRKMQDPTWRAAMNASTAQPGPARTSTLTTTVTIPVVVHVVLPNPYIITEAQVDALIARLNLDFSGLNPDSTNGTSFYAKRGHSLIRFARARRTPTGGFTTGLERRTGSVEIAEDTYQPVKHTSDGGLDPWDVTKYYNIWVSFSSTGVLGIAPAIGHGNATETASSVNGIDGVCIDYSVFSNGCFTDASFNMGRTAVHEIGHNFGLYHIFEGCSAGVNGDFANTTNGSLSTSLYGTSADDTPGQSSSTSGCPSGVVPSSGCNATTAPNPPGKMYQNFMDYTDDACYSMFTKNQVSRMHYILETYRPGYLTTDGATAPAGTPAVDAAPYRFINPNGILFDNTACSASGFSIPVCPGVFTPRIEVVNRGNTTLNTLTVSVRLNGGTVQSVNLTGINLAYGNTRAVTLPSITLVNGANVIEVSTSAPNGGADGATGNDVMSTTLNLGTVASPLSEGFESSFPSTNFNVNNIHGDTTWRKANVGANGSNSSAFINNYLNSNTNSTDDIRFVPTTLATGADSLVISFDVAHKNYVDPNDGTEYSDTLNVLVSNNCGTNYTRVFQKAGSALATGGVSTDPYLAPTAAEWRRERIALAGTLASGQVEVILQNKTAYGNNIFVDNFNITSTCKTTSITTQPIAAQSVCSNSGVTFSVAATGNATLSYQWYKGTTAINGATGATYSIASAQTTDAGTYYAVVKNACNVTTQSGNSVLTVNTGGTCGGTAVSNINTDIETIVLMPNNIRNSSTLRVVVARSTRIEWKVVDAAGRVVKRFTQQAIAGENKVSFDASGLATGAYQLVGDTNKGKTATLKFVRM